MNAILYEAHGLLNGSLVDCLDLLIWCLRHNIDIEFRIISNDESDWKNTMNFIDHLYETRYKNYIFESFLLQKIYNCTKISFVKNLDKAIIFDYTTLFSLKSFLSNINTVYVSNLLMKDLESHNIKNIEDLHCNKIFYEKYYNFIGTEKYRQKYLIKPLKINYCPSNTRYSLIICPGVDKIKLHENIKEGMYGKIDYNFNAFYHFYRNKSSINKELYNEVAEVIYFQSPCVYDRKPRILMEAYYLNIPIRYYAIIKNYEPDGSVYRYYSNKFDTDDREYSFNDKLIKWILYE